MTELLYEVRDPQSGRHYAPVPVSSYYGPHFEKRPSQEEIWSSRQRKEVWHSQKRVDEVEFQNEYCRRAHTFHHWPVHQHQYSTPYEVRPIAWTNQMSAKYEEYKRIEKKKWHHSPTCQGGEGYTGRSKATAYCSPRCNYRGWNILCDCWSDCSQWVRKYLPSDRTIRD